MARYSSGMGVYKVVEQCYGAVPASILWICFIGLSITLLFYVVIACADDERRRRPGLGRAVRPDQVGPGAGTLGRLGRAVLRLAHAAHHPLHAAHAAHAAYEAASAFQS